MKKYHSIFMSTFLVAGMLSTVGYCSIENTTDEDLAAIVRVAENPVQMAPQDFRRQLVAVLRDRVKDARDQEQVILFALKPYQSKSDNLSDEDQDNYDRMQMALNDVLSRKSQLLAELEIARAALPNPLNDPLEGNLCPFVMLPKELQLLIFMRPELTVEDLSRLARVSKKFRVLSSSDQVWVRFAIPGHYPRDLEEAQRKSVVFSALVENKLSYVMDDIDSLALPSFPYYKIFMKNLKFIISELSDEKGSHQIKRKFGAD